MDFHCFTWKRPAYEVGRRCKLGWESNAITRSQRFLTELQRRLSVPPMRQWMLKSRPTQSACSMTRRAWRPEFISGRHATQLDWEVNWCHVTLKLRNDNKSAVLQSSWYPFRATVGLNMSYRRYHVQSKQKQTTNTKLSLFDLASRLAENWGLSSLHRSIMVRIPTDCGLCSCYGWCTWQPAHDQRDWEFGNNSDLSTRS